MYVIQGEGHMGFWWEGEKGGGVFPSRSACLKYLEKIHGKEKAVDIIVAIKKSAGKSILSF